MGWVGTKYDPGTTVRGYIIGSEVDPKLQFAATVVGEPTIRLKRFSRDEAGLDIWLDDELPEL